MTKTRYLADQMGHVSLSPSGPFTAGSFASLTLVYTAGPFGIDDTGQVKIAWRVTSDLGKPQFENPQAPNYTTVEASNGAVLACSVERATVRPWFNTLVIKVVRGFLRQGDTITVRLGDDRQGSAGLRMQTNVEETFEFKVLVDAFATLTFTDLPNPPEIAIVPGPAERWKAVLPTLSGVGEAFRLCVVPEDHWGNPTSSDAVLALSASAAVEGLPACAKLDAKSGTLVVQGLRVREECDLFIRICDDAGRELCRTNPLRIVAKPDYRHFWGDLHGQSEETVGTNSAEAHFEFARDKAFLDIVGHQGNDFQITDAFWSHLNELTRQWDEPGRFLAIPGYEWSGNTGLGGDRNVLYRHEGRPIRRSSRVLVDDASSTDCFTARDLFEAMARDDEDAVVIAHVGGRYADIGFAHDGRFERSVEIHSTHGTFEWLLHDAFDHGYRVGVVCHSDDHLGRPGASRPGASMFGAIGGLTCYQMDALTRDDLFDCLRRRHHFGTTGTRMLLTVDGEFESPVTLFEDDPALVNAASRTASHARMGDIVRPGDASMRLDVTAVGSAPIERIDIFEGKQLVRTVRPYGEQDLGHRVRILWSGAEYRGRGRDVTWRGSARLVDNRADAMKPVNFLNPEHQPILHEDGTRLEWTSVTTGNMAGIDLWLRSSHQGKLLIDTNLGSIECDLETLGSGEMVMDAGGLKRQLQIYRLPPVMTHEPVRLQHEVAFSGQADVPVYARVTQEDGHQAWSSPIYLIA